MNCPLPAPTDSTLKKKKAFFERCQGLRAELQAAGVLNLRCKNSQNSVLLSQAVLTGRPDGEPATYSYFKIFQPYLKKIIIKQRIFKGEYTKKHAFIFVSLISSTSKYLFYFGVPGTN